MVWKLLGIPTLRVGWSDISSVEVVKGVFSLGHMVGVSFMIERRRLIFGCKQPLAEKVFEDVAQCMPGKAIQRTQPKQVF
jgi:hypothetical protein